MIGLRLIGASILLGLFSSLSARAELPHSPVIASVVWDYGSLAATARGSDLWAVAWASDGHQYVIWGDGGGFGGDDENGRTQWGVGRIEGDAENWSGHNVYGGVKPEAAGWPLQDRSGTGIGYKVDSMTAVDNDLVAAMFDWADYPDYKAKIIRSADYGRSWKNSDGTPFNGTTWDWVNQVDGVGFMPPAFVDMGKGYGLSKDGYVYFYRVFEYTKLHLGRVAKASVTDLAAYRYRKSDGTWVSDVGASDPVLVNSDISGVNAIYHPYLKRYILTFNSTPGAGRNEANMHDWTMIEGPTPWGPWYKVGRWHDWLDSTFKFQYRLSPKWIANETDFVLIFSGGPPQGSNTYDWDALHTIKGRFVLPSAPAGKKPSPPDGVRISHTQ